MRQNISTVILDVQLVYAFWYVTTWKQHIPRISRTKFNVCYR